MGNLKKNVLITGTTSGIGYALAKQFAAEGYGLILVSRSKEKLTEQKRELEQVYNNAVHIIAKDLCEKNAAKEIYQELQDTKVPVHILLNNAGFNEYGEFVNTDIEKETDMIQLRI